MIICPNAPVPRATYPEQNHFHQRRDNQLEMGATQRCEMSNLLHRPKSSIQILSQEKSVFLALNIKRGMTVLVSNK